MKMVEWIVRPRPRRAHHLVESEVQPKRGTPISVIQAQGWAHISRRMGAVGEIKGR
jgi:hypothetical protein